MSKKPNYGTIKNTIEVIIVDEPSSLPTITIGCWSSLKRKLDSLFKCIVTPPEDSRPRFSTVFSDWTYPDSYCESDDGLLRWSLSDFTDEKYNRRDSSAFTL